MTRAQGLVLAGAPALGGLLVWAFVGLPDFGAQVPELGRRLLGFVVRETNATNAVGIITYEVRGLDTLAEEFILFSAATGLALLLRELPGEQETETSDEDAGGRQAPDPTDVVRLVGYGVAGFTVLLGIFMVAYGVLTPGGGFQGGVVLASALFTVFLCAELQTMRRVRPGRTVDLAEAVGAAALVVIPLLGLILVGTFFENYLPRGELGHILAGGIGLATSWASGLAVTAGFVLIMSELLRHLQRVRGEEGSGR